MPVSGSIPASNTSTMCSVAMRAATRASSLNRAWNSGFSARCGCITLSARRRSVSMCTTS
ncbi:hypothetical protein BE20_10515 [Sorangium cellulosum]|nr:hypothetical protein BE20_10515 [Sorangium cellulosum]